MKMKLFPNVSRFLPTFTVFLPFEKQNQVMEELTEETRAPELSPI